MADKKTLELQIKVLMQQAQQQIKTFANDMKNATAQMKNLTTNNADVAKAMEQVQTESKRAAAELKEFGESGSFSVQDLKKEIGSLAAVTAAVTFDKWVGNLATAALDASTSFKAAKDDFGIMLGDMQAGAGLFAELQEFNFWTPFDMEQTAQAAKVLMAAKVPLQDMTEYLTRFGDISQGNSQRFQSFINAFSKASAKGKADMEVLNVYIDQGVQILDALGEQMNVTSAEIVDMASKGLVSFQDLDSALASMAAEGGLYYNSMITASQRLDATQAGLEESVKALAASFGDMLAPIISKFLSILTNVIDAINDSPFLKGIFAAALTALVIVINTKMITALVAMASKIWAAYAAQMALNTATAATKPWMLATVAAVATATAGYVAYASAQQKAAQATADLALENQKLSGELQSVIEKSNETDLINWINHWERQISMAEAEISRLQTLYDTVYKPYEDVPGVKEISADITNQIEQLKNKTDEWKKSIEQAGKKLAEIRKPNEIIYGDVGTEWQDKLLEGLPKIQREFELALEALTKKRDDATAKGINVEKSFLKEKEALEKYYNQKKLEFIEKENQMKEEALKKEREAQERLEKQRLDDIKRRAQAELEVMEDVENFLRQMHEERLNKIIEGIQLERAEALAQIEGGRGGFWRMTKNAAKDVFYNSPMGELAVSSANSPEGIFASMLGPMGIFVELLIKTVGSLESVQKVLDPVSTMLEAAMNVLEPVIDVVLKPIIDLLEANGRVLGDSLAIIVAPLASITNLLKLIEPILNLVAEALEWFYMKVIYPVGNAIIDAINAVIVALNKIPFVDIGKLSKLPAVGSAVEEMATEINAYTEKIKKQYERQKDNVESLLDSQLDTLRKQYEFGLIDRATYENQAAKYQSVADEQLYNINLEMEKHLAKIEEYTALGYSVEEMEIAIEAELKATNAIDALKIMIDSFGKLIPSRLVDWVKSNSQPSAQIVQPVANSSRGAVSSGLYVTVNVAGNVSTEKDLTNAIYAGIANGIQTREYTPFPTGA